MTIAPQAPKTATIHPGSVIHCWDHLVITLRDEAGAQTGFLSLYAIAYSASLGAGHVALIDVSSSSGEPYAATLTDDLGLGRRQQDRLHAMGDDRMIRYRPAATGDLRAGSPTAPTASGSASPPTVRRSGRAGKRRTRRSGSTGRAAASVITRTSGRCSSGPGARTLTVGGVAVPGAPFDDDVWVPKLGRSLSSAHGAFAEVRVEPVNGRATGTAPG